MPNLRASVLFAMLAGVALPVSAFTFALATSAPAAAQPRDRDVNGKNVEAAGFGRGSFVEGRDGRWYEFGADGGRRFSFDETGRDQWSVYLNDPSRDVQIQIDLWRQWISYGEHGSPRRDLYRITDARRVIGWSVQVASFGRGTYVHDRDGHWYELGLDGMRRLAFNDTGRDQWSVYLNDPSRDVQIQIDLWRQWITYGEHGGPRRDLYRITDAHR